MLKHLRETGLGSCMTMNQIGSGMYVELSLVLAKGKVGLQFAQAHTKCCADQVMCVEISTVNHLRSQLKS